jgi:hypothetical protein
VDTRGGILLAWDSSILSVPDISMDSHAITGLVHTLNQASWWITVVYGPQSVEEKELFLAELAVRR